MNTTTSFLKKIKSRVPQAVGASDMALALTYQLGNRGDSSSHLSKIPMKTQDYYFHRLGIIRTATLN
jgi:hypothetical protein